MPLSIGEGPVDSDVSRTAAEVITVATWKHTRGVELSSRLHGAARIHPGSPPGRGPAKDWRSFFSSACAGCLTLAALRWDQRLSPSSSSSSYTKLSSLAKIWPFSCSHQRGKQDREDVDTRSRIVFFPYCFMQTLTWRLERHPEVPWTGSRCWVSLDCLLAIATGRPWPCS